MAEGGEAPQQAEAAVQADLDEELPEAGGQADIAVQADADEELQDGEPAGIFIDDDNPQPFFGFEDDDQAFEDAAEIAEEAAAAAHAAGIPAGVALVAGLPPPPLPPAPAAAAMAGLNPAQFQQFLDHVANTLGQNRDRRKLDPFSSGIGPEWQVWRTACETTVVVNGWNNQRARREIKIAIKDPAAQAVREIPIEDEPAQGAADAADYHLLLDLYEARFLPAAAADALQVTFEMASQEETESTLAWHSRLRSIFTRANPGLAPAEIQDSRQLRTRFILGLSDRKVRENTWNRRPANYEQALVEASNMEAGEAILTGQTGRLSFDPFNIKKEANNALGEPPAAISQIAVSRGGKKTDNRECWNCGKRGHISRHCQLPEQGRGGRGRGRGSGLASRGGVRGGRFGARGRGGKSSGRGGFQKGGGRGAGASGAGGQKAKLRTIKRLISEIDHAEDEPRPQMASMDQEVDDGAYPGDYEGADNAQGSGN